ncbi:long-chain-fatty-acid--CoA ligase [Amycolatopsis sp. NPDC049868]|uniref:long-chain-fatty-acid--CoA ligase n=1 Tax=Amycolatopsis sp. NPDC049868 TaxID=3363934 RepID=UPI0037ADD2D2
MPDDELLISRILRRGMEVNGTSQVVANDSDGAQYATFADVGRDAASLASSLRNLGVSAGDRVATLMWNHRPHLAAYFAVPGMGAVLHTLNHRLAVDDLVFIINQAEDSVVLVDDVLVSVLEPVLARTPTVKHVVTVGETAADFTGVECHRYSDLIESGTGFAWPEFDERSAAAMCYTSGTTGTPKGVVYSHRSTCLHTMAACAGGVFGLSDVDRALVLVPMFHVNAWGLPYACFQTGADLLLPDRYMRPEQIVRFIASERATITGGVPTLLNSLLDAAGAHPGSLSSLRLVNSGGSALSVSTARRFHDEHGVPVVQGWGMTETSPLLSISRSRDPESVVNGVGKVVPGVEIRVVDEHGAVLPCDGFSVGEIEVRGPWVTSSYYGAEAPEKFHDGWLRTGDAGSVSPTGEVCITDRLKDVIKSGGEWISSLDLEKAIATHPAVSDVAVIGVADPRWEERPLAWVTFKTGRTATPAALEDHLRDRVARWWIPDAWAFPDSIPTTAVGKHDKKLLRRWFADGHDHHTPTPEQTESSAGDVRPRHTAWRKEPEDVV